MRIRKSAAVPSPAGKAIGTRTKKKHKRLDAINDETFNRNRLVGGSNGNEVTANINNEGTVEDTIADLESVRRSTRVRRAPVLLDASPPPSKKRRKVVKSIERVNVKKTNGTVGLRSLTSEEDESEGEEDGGGWKSRLRRTARVRSRGKRKLFEDLDDEVIKLDTKEFSSGLMIVKSKRSGRAKPSNVAMDGKNEVGSCSVQQDGADKNEVEFLSDEGNAEILRIESESVRSEEEALGNSELLNREEVSELAHVASDIGNANGVGLAQNDKEIIEFGWVKKGLNHDNDTRVKGVFVSQPENGIAYEVSNTAIEKPAVESPKDEGETKLGPLADADNEVTATQTDMHVGCLEEEENLEHDIDLGGMSVNQRLNGCYPQNGEDAYFKLGLEEQNDKSDSKMKSEDNASFKLGLEEQTDKSDSKMKKSVGSSTDAIRKSRIKEGRMCGLCGGATDGRPPKKLVQETGDSDHEACSGSSASEEPNYDLCDGFGDEPGWLGRLLGPINDRFGIAGTWVHQHCAVWSPEVYFAGLGCLKNVRAALCRGRSLKCTRCGRRGATIGCRVDRCPRTYHLPCARADSCIFDHRKFLIACTDHRSLFQPQGDKYLIRMKKLKARKDLRKLANDALTKDIEAEEKWFENCGEDEEFLKRESKRLHRDMLRIAPVHIGGPESEHGKLFEGWESVAGLQDVIRSLKEVVILPLLYPEFFSNLGLTPPRGVLLHGYPGTGKTLVVRALIGSCARGDKRIAYFARKGADCLGKYVGDAERQLRLLFQLAEKSQPSIIFFDEIDGLAPIRTRQQDQTHSSVVSTLLALMDGLKSRGSVVVIGATNRPEAVDPALRRPGRFDREIYFPLPSTEDRASILSLHTQKWPKPLTGSLLRWIARETAGFAGADLQALCTQAAMIALKRHCPLKELLLAATKKPLDVIRAPLPAFVVEERDWLEALSCAPPPCSLREAGMAANSILCSPLPSHLIPCLLQPLSSLLMLLHFDERLSLPPPLSQAARMVGDILVSALDRKELPINSWRLHLNDLLQKPDVLKEIEKKLFTAGVLVGDATFAASGASNVNVQNDKGKLESSKLFTLNNSSSFHSASHSAAKTAGFRILISGGPRSGQRHLASCLLNCFTGNVEIHKVDLATISQEGRGDLLQGLTQLLMKSCSASSCILFLPRLELWAINKHCDDKEEEACSVDDCERESVLGHGHVDGKEDGSPLAECIPTDIKDSHAAVLCASRVWSSFIEQVDSLSPSTSLMFLATSEVPYNEVPLSVRRFFKCEINELSPQEYSVPRFVLRLSGQFKPDMLISSSALKLSKDVAQLIVELIHQRNHIRSNLGEESTTFRIHDSNVVVAEKTTDDNQSADKPLHETEPPGNSLVNALPQPSNRNLKGKSNLILAISTFGYQILRYPHFAELCWVTSKLKDGPCADINGPWKDWPFNSCIVRPTNSSEKVAANCSSGNHNKNNEKFGLVRGLVAVGLSAYRGVYTSLREVSCEVRVVLELLVELINHKIESGKDKYQFGRILSQVAYLEDMVSSWSYTLQRLDAEAQMLPAKPSVQVVASPDNKITCTDNITQSAVNKLKISDNDDLQVVEVTSTRRDSNHEGITGQTINKNHSVSEVCLQDTDSTAVELTAGIPEECNPPDSDSGKLASFPNCEVLEEDSKSKSLDEFASAVPAAASGDDQQTTSRICGGNSLSSCNICDQSSSVPVKGNISSLEYPDNSQNEHHDLPNSGSKASAKAGYVCFYSCCSVCLHTLHDLMIKLILHEWKRWERNGEHGKVEDVHDVVGSFSVNLLSSLRRALVKENFRPSVSDITRFSNHETSEYPVVRRCSCKIRENSLILPSECCLGDSVVTQDPDSPPRLGFIYKDGVLAPMETEMDVSVHCKFDNLCLCAVIEWLSVATEQRP